MIKSINHKFHTVLTVKKLWRKFLSILSAIAHAMIRSDLTSVTTRKLRNSRMTAHWTIASILRSNGNFIHVYHFLITCRIKPIESLIRLYPYFNWFDAIPATGVRTLEWDARKFLPARATPNIYARLGAVWKEYERSEGCSNGRTLCSFRRTTNHTYPILHYSLTSKTLCKPSWQRKENNICFSTSIVNEH